MDDDVEALATALREIFADRAEEVARAQLRYAIGAARDAWQQIADRLRGTDRPDGA